MSNWRRAQVGFLLVASAVACTQRPHAPAEEATPVLLLPGSELLQSGSGLTDTLEYRMVRDPRAGESGVQPVATGRLEATLVTRDGAPAVMLALATEATSGSFHDTAIVAAHGLFPATEAFRATARRIDFVYAGPSVRRIAVAPDSAAGTREHRYDVPVFHFNELCLLVRALPLRAGFRAVVPLYSEGDDALERDTLTVLGRDSAGVYAVRFADAVIIGTYGIDGTTRRIVSFDIVGRKQEWRAHWLIAARH